MILEQINKPNDVKKLTLSECVTLAEEIRQFLIQSLSETGGHLASNLGVVELTIALHRVLEFPQDKLIWDVGHQAYTHKILTGRKDLFPTLRKTDGLSGFPKRKESPFAEENAPAVLAAVHAAKERRKAALIQRYITE